MSLQNQIFPFPEGWREQKWGPSLKSVRETLRWWVLCVNIIGPRERSERGPTKPLLTPYRCTQKCLQNHHFWEASKASPKKWPPLSRAKREKFPSYIPITSAPKSAKKTTTFERRAKRALNKYPILSRAKQEKFQKKTTFERRVERGLTNGWGHSSIYCISAINLKL